MGSLLPSCAICRAWLDSTPQRCLDRDQTPATAGLAGGQPTTKTMEPLPTLQSDTIFTEMRF
eukprot:777008-Lingulodinium_polyedra.AAC.1